MNGSSEDRLFCTRGAGQRKPHPEFEAAISRYEDIAVTERYGGKLMEK